MKLLICGDWHISDKRPESRVDDYWSTVKRKIIFILETSRNEKVDVICQPGDFTDSPAMQWSSFIEITDLFNKYKDIPIFTCYGQHDLRYRNKKNTALDAIISKCPHIKLISSHWNDFYTSSYNEDVPNILDKNAFNILITHRMILKEKIWEGQEDYTDAANFLRSNPFQLIVSGDNHQSFWVNSKIMKKHLFNNGALLRNKTDMIDHKPYVIIFNTETQDWKQIFIPIEPAEKVFNLEKIIKEQERDKNLEAFILGLGTQKEIGMTFEDNLRNYMKDFQISSQIKNIIEESMR